MKVILEDKVKSDAFGLFRKYVAVARKNSRTVALSKPGVRATSKWLFCALSRLLIMNERFLFVIG